MPRYEIEIPGKGKFEVDSPTPLTDQQAYAAVLQQLQAAPVAAPTTAGDIFTALKTGALGSAKALTDVFGADNAASAALAKKLEAAQKEYSPARQAEMAREEAERKKAAESGSMLEEAKVFGRQVLESPLQSAAAAAGSFVPYLPTMLLGPITSALGLSARGVAAATAVANSAPKYIATAQGAGAVKGAMYDAVYQAEKKDGAPDEQAKAKASEAQAYFGQNIDQILLGGGLGRIAGGSGVERLLTKEGAEKAATKLLPRVGKAVAVESATEAPQGAQEQFAANLALQRTGREQPLMQGVLGAGVQEGLMGALGAAPVAAVRGGPAAAEERRRQMEERARAEEQAAEQARAEQEAQAQYRQTPDYLADIQQRYDALVQQENQFKEAMRVKPEGNDPASIEIAKRAKKEAQEALRDFKDSDQYKETLEEYIQARPLLVQQQRQRVRTEEAFGKEAVYEPEDLSPAAQAKKFQDQIDALRKQQAKLTTPAEKQPLENQIYDMEQSLAQLVPTAPEYREAERRLKQGIAQTQQQMTTATSTEDLQRYNTYLERSNAALEELKKFEPLIQQPAARPTTYAETQALGERLDAAQQAGNIEQIQQLLPLYAEATQQQALPFATGYESENQLAEEISRGREEAKKRREAVERETEALFRMGTKDLSPFELGLRKARLDEARATLKAVTKPTGRQVSTGIEYEVTPAGKPGKATEVAKLVRANEQDWAAFDKEQKEGTTQLDRKPLEAALKKKQKELQADVEKFTEYGPSPVLQLLRTELDSVDKALADVKLKNAFRTQAQKPTKKIAGVALKPSEGIGTLAQPKEDYSRYTGAPGMDIVLSEESDKRVADLIDRLLPLATAREPEKKLERPLEGQQAALFDVEAQRGLAKAAAATKLPGELVSTVTFQGEEGKRRPILATTGERPAPTMAQEAPIEQAQRLVEEGQTLRQAIKELNEDIEKAGNPKAPEKVAALQQLREQRDDFVRRLKSVQASYERLTGLQTPAYEPTEEAPATEDLFGPLEEARGEKNRIQAELNKLYNQRDQLKADLQRRGQVASTPLLQALVDQYSKDTPALRAVEEDISRLEQELERVSGKTSERFQEFAEARERERVEVADTRTRTLPGFERRAGVRSVDPEQLSQARTELVALQDTEKELKRALASADTDPTRMMREVAIKKQDELNRYLVLTKDPSVRNLTPEVLAGINRSLERDGLYPSKEEPTAAVRASMDALRKQIGYFSNIIKAKNRRAIQTALTENQKKQDAAQQKIDGLERRQRAYEQQEAVRTGAAPGEAEARRLIEGGGYRTTAGTLRIKPKKLESWGVTVVGKSNLTPVAPAKVAATANMVGQYQREVAAAAQEAAGKQETLERQLAKATKNLENMTNALQQVYPEGVAKATEEEVTNLLASGFTPEERASMRDMAQVYGNLKNSVAGNTTADVIDRLESMKADLEKELGQIAGRRGTVGEKDVFRKEGEEDEAKQYKKLENNTQTKINELGEMIRKLKAVPPKTDPWVSSFNALIAETNTKTLLAAQEIAFVQAGFNEAQKALDATREKIDALKREPMKPSFSARMSNLEYAYDRQLERVQKLNVDVTAKQLAYKTARLEQLNLLKAYGQDLQKNITVEAERIKTLTPQIEKQAKANAETQQKLDKANQMLAAERVKAREAAAKPAPTPPFAYSKEEKAALARIREGLGLPGVRYEADTTGKLVTLTRKEVRDTLNLAQAELDRLQAPAENAKARLYAARTAQADAIREGKADAIRIADSQVANAQRDIEAAETENRDAVQRVTQRIKELERDYEQVMDIAERVVTPVGEGAAERTVEVVQPKAVEGERLPRRRIGTVVRVGTQPPSQMLSGTAESRESISKGNRPAQAGKVRLMASDLDPTKASAVSLAVLDQQRKAATGERKEQLEAAYTAATNGLSEAQIKDKIKEGNDLIKVPGAAEVVAARERERAALAALNRAEEELKAAKTPAAKEIAKDAFDEAEQAYLLASNKREQAQAMAAAGVVSPDSVKKVAEDAIDDAIEGETTVVRKTAARDLFTPEEGGEGFASIKRAELETLPTDAVAELIKDGQVQAALEQLAADSKSDLIRRNARDLAPFVLRTKVKFDPNLTHRGNPVPALYVPEENTIYFRPDEVTEENIVHEAAHAASMRALLLPDSELTDRQRNAKKELEAIFKAASKNKELVGQYGLDNIKEFVSEMQANEEFRALADKQPWYRRFWHAITRLFSRAPMETISQQTDRLIRDIYAPSRVITKAEAAPAIFRSKGPSSVLVGREAGTMETMRGNLFGLSGRVQFFDKLGAADEALIRAQNAGALSDYEAFQTQYYLRLSDMTSQAAGQFITNGPVRIVSQDVAGVKEYRYQSEKGANLSSVSDYMEQAAKAGLGTPEEVENIVTVLIAGERANALTNGWKRLFAENPAAAKAEYDQYRLKLRANPEAALFVERAQEEYKKYNDGLLDFAEQTGFLSPEEVRRLKRLPYVPYYRIDEGVVKLYTDSESWVRIGNIKDNPDLQRLIGDNKKILPILTSAAQNTFMLTRMGLRNKATQETADALFKAGFATKIDQGAGPANVNTVHYKVKGENHFAVIDSDQYGVPADLIVKGMEGIRTTIPMIVQAMGVPANWIRKFVTRSPAYVIRQLIRDPINSAIVGDVDGVPVLNALKQMGKMATTGSPEAEALQRGLIVNSNVFTGDERDMEMFLRSVATGRGKWAKMMSAFDNVAYMTDAATRATIYADSINKGMSEARAQFRALESQNFSRRGLSPTMQWMNTLVPFFNAQIQGLDVLYRASRGKLPFNEQLDIKRKMVGRGLMLAGLATVYAMAMQNDEDYKKLPPEVRYGNFFISLPGVKDYVKVPIPYEVGLIFKALPEMLVDTAFGDAKAKDAVFGIGKLAWQSVPGVVPAAPKPIIEAIYGKTLFGPIESAREKMLEATERYRETTPEVLKMLGGITGLVGVSPLMLEHFVRSYTAALGVSVLRVFDPVLRSGTEGAKPSEGESKLPFVGGLFQSKEGRFLIDQAYERMTEVQQAAETYKDLMKRGKQAEAKEFAQRRADLLAAETMAGIFRQSMGQKFSDERAIRAAPNLTQAQKDALLERIKASQQAEAQAFYRATERTKSR